MNNFVYTPISITNTYPILGYTSTIGYNISSHPGSFINSISTSYPTMISSDSSLISTSYPTIISNNSSFIWNNHSQQSDLSQYSDIEASENDTECIICMSNKRQIVLNPCGHYNMCLGCTDKIINDTNKCPVCQKEIITAIKIFE